MSAKPFLLLAACVILGGCGADAPAPESPASVPETQDPAPSPAPSPSRETPRLPDPTPEQLAVRAQFFSELQLVTIRAFEESFREIDSPEALLAAFDRAAGLGEKVLPPDDPWDPALMQKFDTFPGSDPGIAGLRPSCVAECTVMTFGPNLDDWRLVAQHTSSDLDDAFLAALGSYFHYASFHGGGVTGYGTYFEQTWDYGGYSLLGTGVHTRLLKQIDKLRSETSLFDDHLNDWRAQLLGDAAGWNVCFGPEASDVSEELKALEGLSTLTPDDRAALQKRRAELAAADSPIETSCTDMSCSCSSG